jgi:hypothetical protein
MAEFLILRTNYWEQLGENNSKARMGDANFHATVHRKFDIIEVQEDGYYLSDDYPLGHGWDHNAFYMIQITGLSKQDAEQYSEALMDGETVNKRHKWGIGNIPNQIKNQLETTRTYKIAWSTIQSYVESKELF